MFIAEMVDLFFLDKTKSAVILTALSFGLRIKN